ncbi:hypothetical protein G039_0318580 [Pseudomonas aeruginosa VRFPA01]|nr:hypothetical protein G039_0318580 [Pseudomonas aeruginosa VRFPA01]
MTPIGTSHIGGQMIKTYDLYWIVTGGTDSEMSLRAIFRGGEPRLLASRFFFETFALDWSLIGFLWLQLVNIHSAPLSMKIINSACID